MKRIIDVRRNHLEFTMDSKSANDSVIRFYIVPVSEVNINLSKRRYLIPLLQKHLIVLAYGCAKNDACHSLETMYPLLAFRPLTADVEHVDSSVLGQESPGMKGEGGRNTDSNGPIENRVSTIAVVFCRDLRISVSVGT